MQAIILTGWGRSRQPDIPSSLVDINGKPFMEYQLELLKEYGIDDIIVCIGRFGENINYYFYKGKDFGINLNFTSKEDYQLGVAGAIKKAYKYLKNEFYIIYGDSYFPINYHGIMQFHIKNKKSGLLLIYKNNRFGTKGNIDLENRNVRLYNPNNIDQELDYTYSNTCILSKRIFEQFYGMENITLEDVFNSLIAKNELIAYEISQQNIEINTVAGLESFKEYLKNPVNFL